jgi:hypothetical protein
MGLASQKIYMHGNFREEPGHFWLTRVSSVARN